MVAEESLIQLPWKQRTQVTLAVQQQEQDLQLVEVSAAGTPARCSEKHIQSNLSSHVASVQPTAVWWPLCLTGLWPLSSS